MRDFGEREAKPGKHDEDVDREMGIGKPIRCPPQETAVDGIVKVPKMAEDDPEGRGAANTAQGMKPVRFQRQHYLAS